MAEFGSLYKHTGIHTCHKLDHNTCNIEFRASVASKGNYILTCYLRIYSGLAVKVVNFLLYTRAYNVNCEYYSVKQELN